MGLGQGSKVENTSKDEIALLNDRVQKICGDKSNPLYANHQKEIQMVLEEGKVIYVNRFTSVVLLVMALAAVTFVHSFFVLPVPLVLAALGVFFVYGDFYGGLLHVVLDHPDSMHYPIIDQPSLEFQWHHLIPDDIARKPYLEACGDLNVAVVLTIAVFSVCSSMDPLYRLILACKLTSGYCGQWAHKMAHTPKGLRPKWVLTLQDNNILLPARDHMVHHNTYNDNFSINNGTCQHIIGWMRKKTESAPFWLTLFAAVSLTDVIIAHKLFTAAFL